MVAAAEELAWLLAKFSVEERHAIELRLQRHTIDEICEAHRTIGAHHSSMA